MKKYLKKVTIFLVILFVFGGYFTIMEQSDWKTYTNTDPFFSFSYPASWGMPRVFEDKIKKEFGIDFENYAFYVNNGYYFNDLNGKKPTVLQLVEYYKTDMESKNEIKNFQSEDIEVDNHPAIKIMVENIIGTGYTDVYIYQNQSDESEFILIKGNKDFVDNETFNKILSTFKFKK